MGTQASVRTIGYTPVKPRGATPITVQGAPFTSTDRPMTCGSPANRRRQKASLRTITGWPPGVLSSAARKKRPSSGRTPSTSK